MMKVQLGSLKQGERFYTSLTNRFGLVVQTDSHGGGVWVELSPLAGTSHLEKKAVSPSVWVEIPE